LHIPYLTSLESDIRKLKVELDKKDDIVYSHKQHNNQDHNAGNWSQLHINQDHTRENAGICETTTLVLDIDSCIFVIIFFMGLQQVGADSFKSLVSECRTKAPGASLISFTVFSVSANVIASFFRRT
jgi:hypothetical protein